MRTIVTPTTRTDRILDLMIAAETNGIGVREAIAVTSSVPPTSPSHLLDPLYGSGGGSSSLVADPDENDLRPFVVPASLPADIRPRA
jgi:hypothetical protein